MSELTPKPRQAWREYEIEMHGEVREIYVVLAANEEEARAEWAAGELVLSESSSMEFHSVRDVSDV